MVDSVIATNLNIDVHRIYNFYSIFEKFVHSVYEKPYKFIDHDKITLLKLLKNVKDDIKYDYPLQRLYIYMIIIYSNFISEGICLDLDDKYISLMIQVLMNTNIVHELFKIL